MQRTRHVEAVESEALLQSLQQGSGRIGIDAASEGRGLSGTSGPESAGRVWLVSHHSLFLVLTRTEFFVKPGLELVMLGVYDWLANRLRLFSPERR